MAAVVGFPSRTCTICRLPGHTRNNCNILDPALYARPWDEPPEVAERVHARIRGEITERIEELGFAPMTRSDYCLSVYGISFDEMKRRQRNNEGIPKQKSGNRKPRGYQRWQGMRASREASEIMESLATARARGQLRREEFRNSRDLYAALLAQQGYRSNVVGR